MRYKVAKDSFEIVVANKEDTKLPYDIALDSLGRERAGAIPYIFILCERRKIPISISKQPHIMRSRKQHNQNFNIIFKWVEENYNVLIKHWNKEISDKDILNILSRKDT